MNNVSLYLVTEDEIRHGILALGSPNDHCLSYMRQIEGINTSDKAASKYIDMDSQNKINSTAQEFLNCLKNERIPAVLNSTNIRKYEVTWSCTGIDPNLAEHEDYLRMLCNHIQLDIQLLIEKALIVRQSYFSPLHQDVFHHAKFCCSKCDSFCGRESILDQIHNFIKSHKQKPLILYGPSGSGKTSLVAKSALHFKTWMGDNSFTLVRFLGTSPASSSIRSVLISICAQLCSMFEISAPAFEEYNYLKILQYFMDQLLEGIPLKEDQHLGIFIDAVDQLSPSDGAHTFNWLPKSPPPNVHIIVSILPEEYNCLQTLQTILPFQYCYIEVIAMPQETGLFLMNTWLKGIGRKITSEQSSAVLKAFSVSPQPLHLRLMFHQAQKWRSYTSAAEFTSVTSIDDALTNFFQSLENHYGSTPVRKSLGYLTAARNGLSELELEDVLSLDDEVLNDVYEHWEPSVKGIVRLPALLWKRIRFEINNYLAEQNTCGKVTLAWYHRQFHQAAEKRYLCESAMIQYHSLLSVFFEGTWGGGRGKTITLAHLGITIDNANRQVAEQPLKYSNEIYNLRKLNELPFHLLFSRQIEKLKAISLCNFDWLHTKMIAMSLDSVIEDFELAISKSTDATIETICETLSLSAASIKRNDTSLAAALIGRLHSLQQPFGFHQLLTDAEYWAMNSSINDIEIIPHNNCLIPPGGPLKTTLYGHPQVVLCMSISFPLLFSCSKGAGCGIINIWDFSSIQRIQHLCTLKIPANGVPAFLTAGNIIFSVCSHRMMAWNLNSREELLNYSASCELTSIAATSDGQNLIAGTKDGSLYYYNTQLKHINVAPSLYNKAISCITVDCCNKIVISAAENGCFGICELETNEVIHIISAHSKNITCLLLENIGNSSVIITGSEDKTAKVWDLNNGKLIHTLSGHSKGIKCIATTNGNILTGSLDSTIIIWDSISGLYLKILEGHLADVWCLAVLPGGTTLVTGSKDDYLKVWSIEEGKCLQTLEGHSSWVSCIMIAASAGLIISGSNDKSIKVWKHDTKSVLSVEQHHKQPECIASSMALGLVASGAQDSIKIWSLSNGKCLHTILFPASCLAIIASDCLLISGTKEGTLTVWSLATFKMMHTIQGHSGAVACLFGLGSYSLVSGAADGMIKMWSCSLLHCTIYSGHTAGIRCLTISNDDAIAVSGSSDCTVRVWNLVDGKCIATLAGHTKVVGCVQISRDNALIASGSDDTTVCIWSMQNHTCIHQFKYSDSVKCILFTPDDKMVIAGAHCADSQLTAWSVITGDRAVDYIGHTHAVMCMLLMDHDHIITGSRDGTIKCWKIGSGKVQSTFDLQSQIKHLSMARITDHVAILSSTTKSGAIAILYIRKKDLVQ